MNFTRKNIWAASGSLALLGLALVACSSARTNGGSRVPASFVLSHAEGDFVVDGGYAFSPNVVSGPRFGTFEIIMPNGQPLTEIGSDKAHIIRENHYRLFKAGNVAAGTRGEMMPRHMARRKEDFIGVGLRPIPIADGAYNALADAPVIETPANASGKTEQVRGSEIMDKTLRAAMGYTGQDLVDGPIFGIITYSNIDTKKATFADIFKNLKTEGGITHMGVYIGNGATRNSPTGYHKDSWQVKNYPANVTVASFKGAKDQKTFNTNAILAVRILNELNMGPTFPSDYKFDYFRSISLKEILDFYRGWLDPQWVRPGDTEPFLTKLKSNNSYATYCAEHITIAFNIALNVAQNEQGYKDIWGDTEGAKLWSLAQSRWKTDRRTVNSQGSLAWAEFNGIPTGDATFRPLWKLKGVKGSVQGGVNMGMIGNSKIQQLGFSMAWPAETLTDIARDFTAQYSPWEYVGPVMSASTVLAFEKEFVTRMGMNRETYLAHATPMLVPMFQYHAAATLAGVAEAQREAHLEQLLAKYQEGMAKVFATFQYDASTASTLTKTIFDSLQGKKTWMIEKAKAFGRTASLRDRLEWANVEYKREVADKVAAARRLPIPVPTDAQTGNVKYVQYYSPPAVIQRVLIGLHEHENQFLRLATVATAMDATELVPSEDPTKPVRYDMQAPRP